MIDIAKIKKQPIFTAGQLTVIGVFVLSLLPLIGDDEGGKMNIWQFLAKKYPPDTDY